MSTYFFETITASQALAYTAAADTLVFGTVGSTPENTNVTFGASTITVTSTFTGRSVVFGAGLSGDSVVYPTGTFVIGNGAPPTPVGGAHGFVVGNMDAAHLSHLQGQSIDVAGSGGLEIAGPAASLSLVGTNLTFDSNGQLNGGAVTSITFTDNPGAVSMFRATVTLPPVSAAPFSGWVASDATATAFMTLLAGSDTLGGGSGADLIRGYGGSDTLYGLGGSDTLYGGLGDDVINAGYAPGVSGPTLTGSTYLRGEEGNDTITGGAGFDDANGNMGDDLISTGAGDDYAVGGRDNDELHGDAGNDIVWGNLGADTCDGGDGNDQVRGGQGNDSIVGGAGNDFVSGDRGDDTITGGLGADLFHGSQDAGIDRVLDFSIADGDRVQLDLGTTYTVSQVGADTVIDMGVSGQQMILVGVQMATLAPGSIFLA